MIISPVEKLRRFLKLELSRNCDNRAVVGGMGKFLPNWQKESATAGISPELNEKIIAFLNSYGEKDPEERKAAVNEILSILPPPEEPQPRERNRARRQDPEAAQQNGTPVPREKVPERRPFNERSVPVHREERVERKHRPEPVMNPEEHRREKLSPREPRFPAAAAAAQNNVPDNVPSAVRSAPVRIHHEPFTRPAAPSVSELRARFGRTQVNPKGPSIDSPDSDIPGIGYSNSKALAKQDVYTVRDFLFYFPRRYDDFSSFKAINRVQPDETVTVIGVDRKSVV